MATTTTKIREAFPELLTVFSGPEVRIDRVAPAEHCGRGDLAFVDREAYVASVRAQGPSAVITSPKLAPALEAAAVTVLTAPNVKLARALVTQRFFDRDLRATPPGAHASAVIHEGAEVAASARIGPGTVVGPGARIGEDCVLLANVVVEERAVIGDRSVVHPGAIIGFDCEIGRDVIVQSGVVLGSEGFGFAQDERRKNHRIPQLGKVVVEDRVVIGAGCCIDRGTHGATRIGAGTVMDNLCHVAHNVQIDEDCILTAMLCVAGSTKIGKRVVTSGQTGILDHKSIADDVVLLQRAGVASDIKEPGPYAGLPLMPLPEYLRVMAALRRLPALRDAIKALERRLSAIEAGS